LTFTFDRQFECQVKGGLVQRDVLQMGTVAKDLFHQAGFPLRAGPGGRTSFDSFACASRKIGREALSFLQIRYKHTFAYAP
jgi:hypothetical protein